MSCSPPPPPPPHASALQLEDASGVGVAHTEVRWLFDYGAWQPDAAAWEAALDPLSAEQVSRIGRFNRGRGCVGRTNPDAKACAAARHAELRYLRGLEGSAWTLGKTEHGKPVVLRGGGGGGGGGVVGDDDASVVHCPNYSLSHHGGVLAFAASTGVLVGCDVVCVELTPHPRGLAAGSRVYEAAQVDEFFESFTEYFGTEEWAYVEGGEKVVEGAGGGDERRSSRPLDRLERFFVLWALKEAYTKALGVGLGMDLRRVSFAPAPVVVGGGGGGSGSGSDGYDATARVDGEPLGVRGWRFAVRRCGSRHLVATAAGPFGEAGDALRRTLALPRVRSAQAVAAAAAAAATVPYAAVPSFADLGAA